MAWKIVTKETFMNQELIFPAAQESVLQIVKNAKNFPDCKRIVVFGSSVSNRFSPMSDIDICVDQTSTQHYSLARGLMRGVDYWRKEACSSELLEQIEKEGVLVYER